MTQKDTYEGGETAQWQDLPSMRLSGSSFRGFHLAQHSKRLFGYYCFTSATQEIYFVPHLSPTFTDLQHETGESISQNCSLPQV